MSIEDFTFFTPSQLVEARNQAIVTNKEKITSEFNKLFSRMRNDVKHNINAKLVAAATSGWFDESIKFSPADLICKQLTEEERNVIASYYGFNNHLNLDNSKLYNDGVSTMSTKLIHLNYFMCDILIPITKNLEEIGYTIEWDLFPNAWTFAVNWKLT
jgi:hypothetical protein